MIAMSGGVDSSVAAWLMREAGYDCIGATMKLLGDDVSSLCKGGCPDGDAVAGSPSCLVNEDVEDAKSVAFSLGMPHHVLDFSDSFKEDVIDYFVKSYDMGCTPNPCVECNRRMKFGRLMDAARDLGCDCVATGHYARIEYDDGSGRWLLKKALDKGKDQSYFLYALTQEQLAHTRFPLGRMTKDEARIIAAEHGFVNAKKHDSQDICFVPDGKYAEFIESYTGRRYPEGDFVDVDGNVLGRHKGIIRYTVGQRKGLGIALGEPAYVLRINTSDNTVVLGTNEELFTRTLEADHVNLISCERIDNPMRVKAKIRNRHKEQWATAEQIAADRLRITFDEPQRAVTPGQAVVLYDGDVVVGGGTIT